MQRRLATAGGARDRSSLGDHDRAAARRGPSRCSTFEDITDARGGAPARRRARRGRRAARAARSTSTRRSQLIAHLAVPRLGRLVLRRAAPRRRQHRARRDRGRRIPALLAHRARVRPPLPARPGRAGRLAAGDPHRRAGARSRRSRDEMLEAVAQDAEHLRDPARGSGFRSSMIVPLRAGGRVVGDLALVSAESGRRYGPDDLDGRPGAGRPLRRSTSRTRASTASCDSRATSSRRSSPASPTRSPCRAPTAGSPTSTTPPCGCSAAAGSDARRCSPPTRRARWCRFEHAGTRTGGRSRSSAAGPARARGRGARAGDHPLRSRAPGAGTRWSRVKARPLRGPDGDVTHAINVIEDITDLKQAEETPAAARRGRPRARRLARLRGDAAARRVGSRCPIWPTGAWSTSSASSGLRARRRRARRPGARRRSPRRCSGVVIDPRGTSGSAAVARTGRAELHEQVDEAHLAAAALAPAHRDAAEQLGVRSPRASPMTVRGQRLGVITLSTAGSGRRARAGAARASPRSSPGAPRSRSTARACTGSARRSRARSRARCCRRVLPEIAGIETGALYRAAGEGTDVGGDFYDLFSVAERRVDRRDRRRLRQGRRGRGGDRARALHDPRRGGAAALARGDPALAQRRDAAGRTSTGRFCTIACVHLDTSRARRSGSTVACGGHPPALLRRARRRGGGVRRAGHAARARRRPAGSRTASASCAPATRSCSTRTASPRRARRSACSSADDLRAALAARPGAAGAADRRAARRARDGRGGHAAARRHRASSRCAHAAEPRARPTDLRFRVAGPCGRPDRRSGPALEVCDLLLLLARRAPRRGPALPSHRPCAPRACPRGARRVIRQVADRLLDTAC